MLNYTFSCASNLVDFASKKGLNYGILNELINKQRDNSDGWKRIKVSKAGLEGDKDRDIQWKLGKRRRAALGHGINANM